MKVIDIVGKEFVIQRCGCYFRAISWHPHYIMTEWVKSLERAIADGDLALEEYYRRITGRIDAGWRNL